MRNRIVNHLLDWFEVYFTGAIIILFIVLILGLGMLKCGSKGIDHWETVSPCWGCRSQPSAVCKKE